MKDLKIYGAIKKYVKKSPVRFHMPAHKGKRFLFGDMKYDITELPTVDNAAIVLEAEKDCAKILGAKKVFFLTGGSTSGILSALYAVKDLGKKIVINRSAHKSVYNGLKLFSIEPIIIDDERERITPDRVKKAFDEEKDAFAAIFTYPDYFGRIFDLSGVKKVLLDLNKILIIDGAHGNHFKFVGLPYAGDTADISVESLHKTAYAFNQGAIMCVNDERLFAQAEEGVKTFLTTSPSYPLLSSVEYGIKKQAKSIAKTQKTAARLLKAKEELIDFGLKILPAADPFKITVVFSGTGYDGRKIADILEKHKIFPELFCKDEILFVASAATSNRDIKKLVKAIKKAVSKSGQAVVAKTEVAPVPQRKTPYLFAVNAEWEFTAVSDAKGKICAANFGAIPPCSPIFVAGELIDRDIKEELDGETFGVYDGKVKTVKVKR